MLIDLVTAARTKDWGDRVGGYRVCGEEGWGRLFHNPFLTALVHDNPN